jgi:voltage-gated potassium channel
MSGIAGRIKVATALLLLTVVTGTFAIHAMGGGRWTWFQALFHVVITLSTVGYGELPGMESMAHARALTMVLIVTGTGSVVYFASVVTALVVEGDLRDLFKRNRMRKAIDRLSGHVIVCGAGRTGSQVISELRLTQTPFVAVDVHEDALRALHRENPDLLYLVGDAAEDSTLRDAGVDRAFGIVAALSTDPENLYITLSARGLNPALRIIAKAVEASAEPKLRKAGADKVVSTNRIGGMRLASEMIRPNVTEFLDVMLRDPKHVLRIEEATVTPGSVVANRTLGEASLRKICDVLVVAIRAADGTHRFNPGADEVLTPGSTLIVLGERGEVAKLREVVHSTR